MKIILYTGKGGVGKTSVAAATALQSAKTGNKTLVISTDMAHSLGDSLDMDLTYKATRIKDNLWAQEIDVMHETEEGWGKVQKYLTKLFTSKAIKDISTEELTMFPGMADLLSLLEILRHYREGKFDVIIVDCAPTGETLAFLSFPEMLRWWIEKLFPVKKKVLKATGPLVESLFKLPMPSEQVLDEIDNIYYQLDGMKKVFSDRSTTSIRIVINPEKMVIKEAQRSFTYLNIYDFNIDAIIVNKIIPDSVTDGHFKLWRDIHKEYKKEIVERFMPIPIYYVPFFENEVIGIPMLNRMATEMFKGEDPTEIKYKGKTQEVSKDGEDYIMTIKMPFVDKGDLSLNQKNDELIIKIGSIKRHITLPRTLTTLSVKKAKFEEEKLKIRFGDVKDG